MKVNISLGELFDKITILEIKASRFKDLKKKKNVISELVELAVVSANVPITPEAAELITDLHEVNELLWVIEDKIRLCEKQKKFDDYFIELARSVYIQNDRRAHLKRQINDLLGSELVEEKEYK